MPSTATRAWLAKPASNNGSLCAFARTELAALPDKGYEPVANLPTIIGVAWQLSHQQMLLVHESPHEKRDDEGKREQTPVRTERQRRARKIDERARIHRVAHHCVRSARDDALPISDADGGRRKGVLPVDTRNQQEPEDEEHVAGD